MRNFLKRHGLLLQDALTSSWSPFFVAGFSQLAVVQLVTRQSWKTLLSRIPPDQNQTVPSTVPFDSHPKLPLFCDFNNIDFLHPHVSHLLRDDRYCVITLRYTFVQGMLKQDTLLLLYIMNSCYHLRSETIVKFIIYVYNSLTSLIIFPVSTMAMPLLNMLYIATEIYYSQQLLV